MKVNIGKYPDYFGPYQLVKPLAKIFSEDFADSVAEKIPHAPFEYIHKKFNKRKIKIHIDNYDVWNLDHTLSLLIVPMLKRLKETKHGIPSDFIHPFDTEMTENNQLELFDDLDVYRGISVKNWDSAMDKMIWAFEQIISEDDEPYWVQMTAEEIEEEKSNPNSIYNTLGAGESSFKKIDVVLMEQHEKAIEEGLMLFGKYFRNLWD